MRITIVALFLFSMLIPATGFSQKVTFRGKEVSLKKIFSTVESQTGFTVFYNKGILSLTRPVTITAENMPLEDFLQQVLKDQPVTFRVENNTIIVYRRPRPSPASEPEPADAPAGRPEAVPVSGYVRGPDGKPLEGASVKMKGRNLGTTTNAQGFFALDLPASTQTVLVVSFVGLEPVEYKLGENTKDLQITLKEKQSNLNDVVVTGYANVRKSSFTGTSTRVERKDILSVNSINLISALQVFDPSLRIARNIDMGSDPNTLPEFYVRGRSGLSSVTELDRLQSEDVSQYSLINNPNLPVFIMDGYEVPMQRVYDYDINRIESVTILKDAAATAIYGSRASNGVIVIETKAPQQGKLRVSYNFSGVVTAPDLSDYNLMNAQEKLEAEVAAGLLDPINPKTGSTSDYFNRLNVYRQNQEAVAQGVNTYWLSQPLSTQFNHRHSLYVEGGERSLRFGIGLNYDGQNGVMKESFRNRMGADFKIDYRLQGLQVTNQVSYSQTSSQNSPYGSFSDYTSLQPYLSPTDPETGEYVKTFSSGYNGPTVRNPLYEASLGNFDRSGYQTITNNLSLNAFFLRKFQFKAQLAINYQLDEGETFVDPASPRYSISVPDLFMRGELNVRKGTSLNWNANMVLNYTNSINGHNMNFSLGYNATETKATSEASYFRGFPSAQLHDQKYAKEIVSNPSVQDKVSRLMGTFLFSNYTYRDIYLADVSVRLDGSSEFGSDNRFATFWSLGAGLNLHKYEFMSSVKWLNTARIRANYGQTGKNNFPPYAARHTYQVMLDYWFPTGIGGKLYSMGNNQLKWEKANTLNIGLDLSFLNRVNLTMNWYDKRTNNLITNMTIPSSTGFTSYRENVGEVMNRGYEIDLNLALIKQKDFNLNLIFRGAHNENRIVKISDALKEYNDRVDAYYAAYNTSSTTVKDPKYARPITKYVEGGSETSIFGMQSLGISPATGQELYMNRDGSVTYTWNAAEQVILGNTEPTLNGSFGINARYKNWTLYSSLLYEYGGEAYNSTLVNLVENADVWLRNVDKRVMTQRWLQPGDVSTLKSIKDRYNTTRPTSRFVQKNNNLSFNSLSIGYDFDRELVKRAGLSMLRVQANMNEVLYLSTIKRERGLSYPYARTFTFSLNASF